MTSIASIFNVLKLQKYELKAKEGQLEKGVKGKGKKSSMGDEYEQIIICMWNFQ